MKPVRPEDELSAAVFNDKWQEAVFGHIFKNYAFFLKCKQFVKPEFFIHPNVRWLYGKYIEFYDSMKRVPEGVAEFRQAYISPIVDINTKKSIGTTFDMCVESSNSIGLDLVSKKMTGWIKLVTFVSGMEESRRIHNSGDFIKAIGWMESKIKEINTASFDGDGTFNFQNLAETISTMAEDEKEGVHTGSPLLDELMVEQGSVYRNPQGKLVPTPGFRKGDITMIMGPVNSGKTTLMVTFVRHALMQGYSVLYITHEQKDTDIAKKLTMSLCGVDGRTLYNMTKDDVGREHLRRIEGILTNNFVYRPYNIAGGMYVEDVVAMINRFQEERISRTGKGFDMVVNDYPGKLQSRAMAGKRLEMRNEQTYIYDQFVQLALQHKFHVIAGVQTNREAYKTSRKGDDFIGMEGVSESFGIMQIASNVLTINRSDDNKQQNKCYIYVAKSRSSETGTYLVSEVDMGRSLMFGPSLPASTGRSGKDGKAVVEELLDEAKAKAKAESSTEGKNENKV
jgi:KaiC/GvpD/RAD55 family RecA-like ATPase